MQSSSTDTGVAKSPACENCSRAKTKCTSQLDDITSPQCARCFRLKKECVAHPRAKRKKRAPNTSAGTAELESKIESLLSLLSASQVAKAGAVGDRGVVPGSPEFNLSTDSAFRNEPSNGFTEGEIPMQPDSVSANLSESTKVTPPSIYSRDYTPIYTPSSTHNGTTSLVKTPEELLKVFRDEFMTQIPYAIISPNVTAAELLDKRPWLYRMIIMAASSHERQRQIETGKRIISELSTALLTEGEKSLDMLQALLVYSSWSHCFAAVLPYAQSTGIMQLALALVYDLSLHKVVLDDAESSRRMFIEAKNFYAGVQNVPREYERSLDERRALLYAFYLSSTFSTCIRKSDGLQSSPYISYSCKMLQESAEFEADVMLVACVRFQSIVDSVRRAVPHRLSNSEGRSAPLWMHTGQLQNEVQTIHSGLSADLQDQVLIKLSYHNAEISLTEAAIWESHHGPTFNSRRIDLRWSCLMACKSLLDSFLTLPFSTYHAVSMSIMSQIAFGLTNLFRLSFVEDPGWDLAHVRETGNLTSYLEHFASGLEQVGASINEAQNQPAKEPFHTSCARAMRFVKDWYGVKLATFPVTGEPPGQASTEMMDPSFDTFNCNSFDYMDEAAFQELMADFSQIPMDLQ